MTKHRWYITNDKYNLWNSVWLYLSKKAIAFLDILPIGKSIHHYRGFLEQFWKVKQLKELLGASHYTHSIFIVKCVGDVDDSNKRKQSRKQNILSLNYFGC